MQRVVVGDASFITNDKIAESIVKYAAVLQRKAETATVEVPAVGSDGSETLVTIALGTTPVVIEALYDDGDLSVQASVERKGQAPHGDQRQFDGIHQTDWFDV